MARVLTNENNYYNIADTIRQMKNVNTTYKPREMASALKDIYSNEVEGTLPLSFEANGNFLLDYRIDGASGGVGDRTGNLFTNVWFQGVINASTGIMETSSIFVCSDFIPITPLITYSCSRTVSREYNNLRCYDANKQYVGTGGTNANIGNPLNNGASFGTFMITNESVAYIRFNDKSNDLTTKYMLVEGEYTASTMPDYEPYGYKVPVVVNGKNLLSKLPYSRIDKGIEYTNVNNLYLHIEGTSNAAYSQTTPISLLFKKGKYYINFYCDEQYKSKLFVLLRNNNNIDIANVYSSGASFELNNDETIKLIAGVRENNTTINTNMYIQIVSGITSQSTYEPYIEPTTTNIYLDNPIRTINDEVEYIDYSEQKQHRVRKNLLQNTATTQTINGVNVIVNNDGSIKLSGTSTAITYIDINSNFNSTEFQDCYLNPFYPNNFVSSASTVLLRISNTTNRNSIQDFLNNSVIRDNGSNLRLAIRIGQNYTFSNNFVISPMISKFSDNTYEPYIENTEVDVTLPAIPTLDGTNTLSIDTTIQPSNVYIQAPKDSIEATMIAHALEEI